MRSPAPKCIQATSRTRAWKGRKALVLGSGTSGHDVAQELQAHRRRRHHDPAQQDLCGEPERSAERLRDLFGRHSVLRIATCSPPRFPIRCCNARYQLSTAKGREVDKMLLDAGSKGAASAVHFGEDETGFQMMYLRRGGGYYFNVGCSDLIISGAISLLQFADIERFVANGARLRDGRIVPPNLLVLATGYKNQQETARLYLGDDVAERIGPVWGFDEGGELRNMWRRTAQPGLWFTAGSLAQCRIFSRYLALADQGAGAGTGGVASSPSFRDITASRSSSWLGLVPAIHAFCTTASL
mgnify:CR=1 FL=1